jgi:hypothetical protein
MSKEREIFWGISFWILFLAVLGFLNVGVVTWETARYPEYAQAATTAVSVTATVAQNITCSTAQSSTAFGTLSSASITTSSPNATTTMSCGNVSGGCTLYVRDVNGGLATTSPAKTIQSASAGFTATTTLVAGTEGFGLQATSSATASPSGQAFTFAARYAWPESGNIVGGATTTNQTVVSTTATTSGRAIEVRHKAAISDVTPAAIYTDTLTYECLAT